MLCLPGPENPYRYDGDFKISGVPIYIKQEGGQGRGTAWCVWDGAVVLARYIDLCGYSIFCGLKEGHAPEAPIPSDFPLVCIELGSGTGLAGLSAAQLFQVPVALTDIPEAMPALKANVDLNPDLKNAVFPVVLDWNAPDIPSVVAILRGARARYARAPKHPAGNSTCDNCSQLSPAPDDPPTHEQSVCATADAKLLSELPSQHSKAPDASDGSSVLVLASDCVWVQGLIEQFVTTLQHICNAFEKALVLLAHKSRSKYVDRILLDRLKQVFDIEELPQLPGEWRGSIEIWKLVPNGTES